MKNNKHKQFDEMLMLYFYDELSPVERRIFQNHLDKCPYCQQELNKLKEMVVAVSKVPVVVPTKELMKRANLKVLNEIGLGSKATILSKIKDKIEGVLDLLTENFPHPKYQLIAIGLTFVVGIFVGKMWLSSSLLNDPEMLANFIRHKPGMTKIEENGLKNALADYMLRSGDVEISDLVQA